MDSHDKPSLSLHASHVMATAVMLVIAAAAATFAWRYVQLIPEPILERLSTSFG
jgi:hypothetical protein